MVSGPAPPRSTLPDSPERKPSGILLAMVFDHGASVSSSFPSRVNLGGSPLLLRRFQKTIPHLRLWGGVGEEKQDARNRGSCAQCVAPPFSKKC